nr:CHASE3 domain-containing protein [uncultured Roseateles sp.]
MQAQGLDLLSPTRRKALVFPLAVVMAVALILISELAFWRSTGSMDKLGAMAVARLDIQQVLRRMIDAETGQRGYLLSARKDYLEPYREASQDVQRSLAALKHYYEGNQPAAAPMLQLETMAQRRLSELDLIIELFDQGKEEAWRNILLTDIGKEQMQSLRDAAQDLLALETIKVEAGRKDVYDTLLFNRIGVALTTLISLLALFLYLRQSAALQAQRAVLQRAVQDERDQLEIEVGRRTGELTELTRHLFTAREDERSRLARELHDELGALLTTAKLDAARIKARLGQGQPEASERLQHLNETLNLGIALKRRIIEDLRPSSLSNLGLAAALEILAREFGQSSGLDVRCELRPVDLSPSAELTAFRLVQESLTNIAKYAQAGQVNILLEPQGEEVCVEVRDDGVGFDTGQAPRSAHGLLGMRYRVVADGGRLVVHSAPGEGCRIAALLPRRAL